MTKVLWAMVLSCTLLGPFSVNAQNIILPSDLDCTEGISADVAQLTCRDPKLRLLWLQLMQVRQALSQQLGAPGMQWLKDETAQMDTQIRTKCQVSSDNYSIPTDLSSVLTCIGNGYQHQRSAWLTWLTPEATSEANRSIDQHMALEKALQTLGFLSADVSINGYYGKAIRSAIASWQEAEGLSVTGIIDKNSASLIMTQAAERLFGPSYNCKTAPDPIHKLICQNRTLSLTQLKFVQVEEAFIQQVGVAGAKQAADAVETFYDDLQNDCAIDTGEQLPVLNQEELLCLIKIFKEERSAWMLKLSPAAKEEASRPIEYHAALQRSLKTLVVKT